MNVMPLRHSEVWILLSNEMAKFYIYYAMTLKNTIHFDTARLSTHHSTPNSQKSKSEKIKFKMQYPITAKFLHKNKT